MYSNAISWHFKRNQTLNLYSQNELNKNSIEIKFIYMQAFRYKFQSTCSTAFLQLSDFLLKVFLF